jgi:glycosyltransferase involved in cell wall biosynthesis
MKVGIVTHYMPPHVGGIEQFAEALSLAYERHGLSVRWVASRAPRATKPREGNRIRVPCCNIAEDRLGVPIPIWGLSGLREVSDLARWADVIHVHDSLYISSLMAVASGRWRQTPVLVTQHIGFVNYKSAFLNLLQRAGWATLAKTVLRAASFRVFSSPAAEEFVCALLGGRPANTDTIPTGVDVNRFRPPTPTEQRESRARLGLPAEGDVVLFVGRLVAKKGIPIVTEMIGTMPDVHFLLVGDGPLATLVDESARNMTWKRSIPHDELHECLHAANALVMPSHGEGLPIIVQEAMASGLPVVISSDEPYARSMHEAGACLIAARTAGAMNPQTRRALAEAASGLSQRSRAYAERNWSMEAIVERYVAILDAMVGRG